MQRKSHNDAVVHILILFAMFHELGDSSSRPEDGPLRSYELENLRPRLCGSDASNGRGPRRR